MAALNQVFNIALHKEGLSTYVKNFDFSQAGLHPSLMNVKDDTQDDFLHLDLAPAFGKLTSESIKQMDDELKVMISGTMRTLKKARAAARGPLDWETIVSVLMQNTLLEPFDAEIVHDDKLIKENTNFFKFNGEPDQGVVEEVNSWFINLINDEDVLNSTHIDIGVMARIVAQTGASITSIETAIYKVAEHTKRLVDIGVLRFPDPQHPYFKVYRIQLKAWSHCERITGLQFDKNGIVGNYAARKFRPRKAVIQKMQESVMKKAVAEAEAIFD
ncbi:hypothetical protein BV20DRAFT_977162 [Pilatotrama ljubarskyi]|nr:hypothetical protein BV20DRAFT_977162 [Pilatotrama ljubarskyi]